MAKILAVVVVASCIVSVCNAQGYGGVPQAAKGVRTTTTFAPDVIPSDKQAEIFYQKNPNPEDVYRPAGPQYNQPNPSVPQNSNPNPSIPQYNKPNPGVPQNSPQPNPGVPQSSNPQPVGQYPGPLPDNSIYAGSFTESQGQGGNFWWMNQDNPFKGADVPPQPPKGSNPPSNSGPPHGGAPLPPQNNPNNPFLTGGAKPGGSYPAPGVNNPAPSGNNPNNPFLSGSGKPSGPYPIPSGSPPSAVNPSNPFLSGGGNNQGCGGNAGCGSQSPQGESYPGNQVNQGVPCTGAGYLCVSKSNCNNGIVVDNGLVQAKAGVQRCDSVSQTCCRLPSRPNYPGANYPGGNYPGGNVPVKPTGGSPPYQNKPIYQGQGSAPGTNGVPIGGSIYDRPVTPNPVITPYTGPLNVTPYPGCAAALKCVELIYCTAEGVMADTPQALTREQEENRVPLSECSNPDTGILGKCCRDPNYKDPWPGGMMMHVHHEGDHGGNHGGQFVDQQGFPTGQYDASQGNPSQQQFNQQPLNVNVPKPFPQKPFQPQPAPQQNFQPPQQPQYRPQPQQPQQNVPQYQPQPQPRPNVPTQYPQGSQNVPQGSQNIPKPQPYPQGSQNIPKPQPFPQGSQNVQKPQPFPQGSQNVQKPQPYPQGSQDVQRPQPFPQQPPPQQNYPKPIPQPIVPQYQPQKPDLPPWQPTQVNFASQTPEKVPYQPAPGYPSAPQQQYEPAQSVPNTPVSVNGCGIKGNVDRSGISDLDVAEGEFPWHAMILSSTDRKPLCSAAVVSDRAILTAAHCLKNLESREISVSIGGVRLAAQSSYPVAAIARHPKFDADSQFNDLAVVFLSQPGSGLRPICLPENSGIVGGKCIATGYSRKAIQSNTGSLHQVEVYSVPRDVCEEKLKATSLGKYYTLNPSFTCALPTNPQTSVCKVGAGSPISCERSGVYHLGGTYSWDVGCTQEETPAALAVPDVDWIRSVISRPIEDVLREEQNEVEKRKASQEVVDSESKPGFSQGYGK